MHRLRHSVLENKGSTLSHKRPQAYAASLIIAATFLFPKCSETPKRDADPVNSVIYKLIEADNDADIPAILRAYTDSVEFFPPSGAPIRGIQNVRASYERLFIENQLAITTEITNTNVLGDHAFISGANKGFRKSKADSKMIEINDRYVAILVRSQDGNWKIDKLYWHPHHASKSP